MREPGEAEPRDPGDDGLAGGPTTTPRRGRDALAPGRADQWLMGNQAETGEGQVAPDQSRWRCLGPRVDANSVTIVVA